jgi:hypothetical protein
MSMLGATVLLCIFDIGGTVYSVPHILIMAYTNKNLPVKLEGQIRHMMYSTIRFSFPPSFFLLKNQ